MAKVLTEADAFTGSVTVPEDGDNRNAASVETPFQALANRTRNLKNRVDPIEVQVTRTALSPSSFGSSQNDYTPTDWATGTLVRLTATAADLSITGAGAAPTLARKTLVNVGSYAFKLTHEDASSTAANRFICPGANGHSLYPNESVDIEYDPTSSRWRVLSDADTGYEITNTLAVDADGYTPAGWSAATVVRIEATANVSLTGLGYTAAVQRKTLVNVGDHMIVLEHQNTGSGPSQRLACPDGIDYWLHPGEAVEVVYSATTARWHVIAASRTTKDLYCAPGSGTYDNFTPTDSSGVLFSIADTVYMSGGGASEITGFSVSGLKQKRKFFVNNAPGTITFKNQDSGSSASNRIITSTATDVVLDSNEGAILVYDATATRWRIFKVV